MLKLRVIRDFREEGWPSMELTADELTSHLKQDFRLRVEVEDSVLLMKRRLPMLKNADRLLNRFWDYPRYLKKQIKSPDLYHVCDHTYSHLVHELPLGKVGVYCHDLDAFRSLLDPRADPRSLPYRLMAKRMLTGLEKAPLIFHSTQAVREEAIRFGVGQKAQWVHAPYGISKEYVYTERSIPSEVPLPQNPFILHVGINIPRKALDFFLEVFLELCKIHPKLLFVQLGGEWSRPQQQWIAENKLSVRVLQFRSLSRTTLAAFYSRCALAVLPSDREGFGLPVIEALACGAPVLASDLPVVHEVGASAILYSPVREKSAWISAIQGFLKNPEVMPPLKARLAHSKLFTWEKHTEMILTAYEALYHSSNLARKVA